MTDRIADVRLARPEKLNALDPAMFEALLETGRRLAQDRGPLGRGTRVLRGARLRHRLPDRQKRGRW